jgi:hypothetical protein
MVNREVYKSALNKIVAKEDFKSKTEALIASTGRRKNPFRIKILIPSLAVLGLLVFIGSRALPSWWNKGDTFRITGKLSPNVEACYASVLYLDGYVYSPSEWLKYNRYNSGQSTYDSIRGEKLGEVTLDLKGLKYEGTPPDFSSTHDVGSQIYAIKNVKKEHAVLFADKGFSAIFYREGKALADDKTPIGLTVSEVFRMISDSPIVSAVELRDENDGSWMRTSEDKELLSIINKELPELQILRQFELGQDPYMITNLRTPVNLVFPDGAVLHMQVFPEINSAAVFGGFVKLSPELSTAIKELSQLGEEYPSIAALLPYSESDVSYLHIVNHIDASDILCKEPKWSASALFSSLRYYRVKEIELDKNDSIVMTFTLGSSKEDSITMDFYETDEKYVIIKLNNHYYRPAKGNMVLQELVDFLSNFTSTGS